MRSGGPPEPTARDRVGHHDTVELRERLSEDVIRAMAYAYRAGATAHDLAAAHDLSLSSVKRLLRSAGPRPVDKLRKQHRSPRVPSRFCPALTASSAAVKDVVSGGSLWITMRWLADGFLSQRTLIATLP
jgi:hypothetical protein